MTDGIIMRMARWMKPVVCRDPSQDARLSDDELYDMAKYALVSLQPGDEWLDLVVVRREEVK